MISSDSLFLVASVVNVVVSLGIGVIVLILGFKERINQVFFAFAITEVVAYSGHIYWLLVESADAVLIGSRITLVGVIFMQVLLYHFVLILLNKNWLRQNTLLYSYLMFAMFLPMLFTKYFIADVTLEGYFVYSPVPGPLYKYFMILWSFFVLINFSLVLRAYTLSTGNERKTLSYMIYSFIVGFTAGILNLLAWVNESLFPAGHLLISIAFALISYPIIKSHLMDSGNKNMVTSAEGVGLQFFVALSLSFTVLLLFFGLQVGN